jgi:hypothetical protein
VRAVQDITKKMVTDLQNRVIDNQSSAEFDERVFETGRAALGLLEGGVIARCFFALVEENSQSMIVLA